MTAQRIAIDLNHLLPGGENGGSATATLNQVREIVARGRTVLLLMTQTNAGLVDELMQPGVERYIVRRQGIEFGPGWSLAGALGADVLFCPFGDPFWAEEDVPTVCTINDLQHLDHPEFFSAIELDHRADYLHRLVAKADVIAVPSRFTRESVIGHLAPSAPIAVVGYSSTRHWPSASTRARRPEGRYLLYPANAWAHKNHKALWEALALHRVHALSEGTRPLNLVCTGATLDSAPSLEQDVVDFGIADLVTLLGHVDDGELRALFEGAEGLIFPSLYEGFGMPVLEAMSFGIPVACSNITALPEVAGDAALLFDPRDPREIAQAIDRLGSDAALRRSLTERGLVRAAEFDSDRTVTALLDCLDAAAESKPRTLPNLAPTVSAVMPSYNQGEFIERSIGSVLEQGDLVLEFRVQDGGSSDNTVAILQSHADYIDFVTGPDGGQAAAVNAGIASTKGDVIGWLNSDDIWYPGAIATATTVLAHNPDLQWVYFAADHIDASDAFIEPYDNRPWDLHAFGDWCCISQPACFFRRSIFEEAGPLNESLRFCMDYDLWIRMGRIAAPVYVPVVTSGSRLHPQTKTLSEKSPFIDEILRTVARHYGRVTDSWLLSRAHEFARMRQEPDMSDQASMRRWHRTVLWYAIASFVRFRAFPQRSTRSTLAHWFKLSYGKDRPKSRRTRAFRRLGAKAYHAGTGPVRRRTAVELSPRLQRLDRRIARVDSGLKRLRRDFEAQSPGSVEFQRITLLHHQLEELVAERFGAELSQLRRELDELKSRMPDA